MRRRSQQLNLVRAQNLVKARAAKAAKHANGHHLPDQRPFNIHLDAETARALYIRLKLDEEALGPRLSIVADTLAEQSFGLVTLPASRPLSRP